MGIATLGAFSVNYVVLCDFDGTIVDIDTAVFVLEEFADPVWKVYDEQFERGEMTLEECLQKQFATVKASKQEIKKQLDGAAELRQGFEELVDHCHQLAIPVVVVSAGLDFVIDHLLQQYGLKDLLERHGPKTTITDNGIRFTFPKLDDQASVNFKDDFVRLQKGHGKEVVYVGDGYSDYPAAKIADVAFAIKGSALAELLTKNEVQHKEMVDFRTVIHEILLL